MTAKVRNATKYLSRLKINISRKIYPGKVVKRDKNTDDTILSLLYTCIMQPELCDTDYDMTPQLYHISSV